MKTPTTSAILGAAVWGSCAFGAVTMGITKNPDAKPKLRRKHLSARASVTEVLNNNATGGDYIAEILVGTPPQKLSLLIDTGSSDVWMLSSSADLCTDPALQDEYGIAGCTSIFDQSKSSSYKVAVADGFSITYADNSGADGDYITDNLSIGGVTIKALEMGLALSSSSDVGVLGIGYDLNEASNSATSNDPFSETNTQAFTYPSIVDQMVTQGLISSKAYSLYLDDLESATGSIIFGGLDSDKYHGSLLEIPIVPDRLSNGTKVYAEFAIAMTGFGITSQTGQTRNFTTTAEAAILDSGTTITYLPDSVVSEIVDETNAYDDSESSGNIYVDCSLRNNASMTFNYGFGGLNGIVIKVPINELVFDLTGAFQVDPSYLPTTPFQNTCALGVSYGGEGPFILGDTFLRSAYVVYDLQNNLIALAQTNFNSTTSSIVDFQANPTGIPNVSGVASSALVTQTATGIVGGDGGKTVSAISGRTSSTRGVSSRTSSASGTVGTGAAATSKSAAVGAMPAFEGRGWPVWGFWVGCAVLGGGMFLV